MSNDSIPHWFHHPFRSLTKNLNLLRKMSRTPDTFSHKENRVKPLRVCKPMKAPVDPLTALNSSHQR